MSDNTPSTVTVSAAGFMRAVANATLSASTDDTLPLLTAIHIYPDPNHKGELRFEATNRYVASQERIPLADLLAVKGTLPHDHFIYRGHGYGDEQEADRLAQLKNHLSDHEDHKDRFPPGYVFGDDADDIARLHEIEHGLPRPVPETELDVVVGVKDLAKAVKIFKLATSDGTKYAEPLLRPHVVISRDPGAERVSLVLVQSDGPDTSYSPQAIVGNDYPPVDRLMDQALSDDGEIERFYHIEQKWLAILAKVETGEKSMPVRLRLTRAGKPVLAEIGEHYRCLIVPVRPSSD